MAVVHALLVFLFAILHRERDVSHTCGEEMAATSIGEGSVLEAGDDVGPVADDVVLHAGVAFSPSVGADVFLTDVFAKMAALERP